jgi:hypothetical protein
MYAATEYEKGPSLRAIGRDMNLSPSTIANDLRLAGITVRSRGGSKPRPREVSMKMFRITIEPSTATTSSSSWRPSRIARAVESRRRSGGWLRRAEELK